MSSLGRSLTRVAVLAVLLLGGLAHPARAQTAPASVHVVVTEAASGAPLPFARVFVIGPRNRSALTGADGAAVIEDLPPGQYAISLGTRGFVPLTVRDVAVEAGRTIAVAAKLQKAGLTTIGSVAVRSSAGVTIGSVTRDGDEAAVSQNVLDALRLGSGVSSLPASSGGFVSVDGHAPGDTGIAIDGVPIAPPGSPLSTSVLAPSLFAGLSVDRDTANGSSSMLDFRTADPTIGWQSSLRETVSSSRQSSSLTVRGSAGFAGISFSHAVDVLAGPLQGLVYGDQSGSVYPHTDRVTSTGDAAKFRLPAFGQVFTLSAVRIATTSARACERFSAPLPCGYGPRNSDTTALSTYQIRDTAVVGATSLSAAVFEAAQRERYDFAGRTVQGVRFPVDAAFDLPTSGFQWTIEAPAGRKHDVSLSGYAVQGQARSAGGTAQPQQLGEQFAYRTLTLADSVRLSKKLRGTFSLARQSNSKAASTFGASVLTFDPGAKDRITLRYASGALSAPTAAFDGVSDAPSLQFDCNAPASFGTGPQSGADKSTTTSARLSWLHRLRGDDQLLVTAHRDVVYDGAVATTISAADVPALLPPGYAGQVDAIFRSACGTNASLAPARQYLSAGAIAPVLHYDGVSLAARLTVSPRLFVRPYSTFTSATERGAARYLTSASSTVVPGAQLPGVPPYQGGVLAGLSLSRNAQLLVDANYTSSNNAQRLPANWTLNAAYGLRLAHGTLSLTAVNLTNAFPGPFATRDHAVALATRAGPSIPTVAAPNVPRTVLVRYAVTVGKQTSAPGQRADLDADSDAGEQPSFTLLPFDTAVPGGAFVVQTTAESCGPERVSAAKKALALVEQYAAAPPASGDLERDGLRLTLRRSARSYSVLIGGSPKLTNALFACAAIHGGGRPDAAAALGLYVMTRADAGRYDLAYSPQTGFYVTDVVADAEPIRITYLALPDSAPADPFALRPPSECPAQVRAAATALLQRLSAAAAAGDGTPLQAASPWIASRHGAGASSWLEASLPDPAMFDAVVRCAYVHAGNADALRARGFGAPGRTALGYAPALGLYVVSSGAG